MADKFMELVLTPAVQRAQEKYYRRSFAAGEADIADALTEDEAAFIRARDSFYMATVNEHGWPYIQHRGGPKGFLRVLGPHTLAFADYGGNRQMISTGNLTSNDRVALMLMDYRHQARLKILGRVTIESAKDKPEWIPQLADPSMHRRVERLYFIDVAGYDWNCPQHITPRFSAEEVEEAIAPLHARIAALEAQLKQAR
jgi:predicted pyridoxine 5'-phosphate oxidase superfamily flavin-nucleotide-binding protein